MSYELEFINMDQFFNNNDNIGAFLKLIPLLNKSKINPDELLIISCKNILDKIDQNDDSLLLPFALALRYKANKNTNINKDHILKYLSDMELSMKINNNPLINSMIIMLLISGFKVNENNINNKIILDYQNNIDNLYNTLDPKYLSKLLVMLDLSESKYLTDISITEVIRDHSLSINKKIINDINNSDEYYKVCINYLNLGGFKMYIKTGNLPSYYVVNNILLYHNIMTDNHNKNVLYQFITYLIENGYRLGPYQLNYLPPNFMQIIDIDDNIVKTYNNENDCNLNLLLLTDLLFIDKDKGKMYILNELRMINSERMKIAAIKMSILRSNYAIDPSFKYIKTDFETSIKYQNIKYRFRNLEEINTIDLCNYIDENGIKWVFTNELFESILHHRKNPYTDTIINNEKLLTEIKNKRNQLKRLGIQVNINNIETSSNNTIVINYDYAQIIRQRFFNLGKLYNITPYDIESLTIHNIEYLLNKLKISDINIKNLHKDHAHLTFYRVVCEKIQKDLDIAYPFFSIIKNIIK